MAKGRELSGAGSGSCFCPRAARATDTFFFLISSVVVVVERTHFSGRTDPQGLDWPQGSGEQDPLQPREPDVNSNAAAPQCSFLKNQR